MSQHHGQPARYVQSPELQQIVDQLTPQPWQRNQVLFMSWPPADWLRLFLAGELNA